MVKCSNVMCKWIGEKFKCTKKDIDLTLHYVQNKQGEWQHFLKCDKYEESEEAIFARKAIEENLKKNLWD